MLFLDVSFESYFCVLHMDWVCIENKSVEVQWRTQGNLSGGLWCSSLPHHGLGTASDNALTIGVLTFRGGSECSPPFICYIDRHREGGIMAMPHPLSAGGGAKLSFGPSPKAG